MIEVAPHPLLDLIAFETEFAEPLGSLTLPAWLGSLLRGVSDDEGATPTPPDEEHRKAVRDLLRHGGFKPTGRSKPASEYLRRAADQDRLGAINLAVDLGNAVSLHSGLPISVVDLDRVAPPLRIGLAPAGAGYAFNPAGQVLDAGGLLCLADADGPCANAVKDAQRSKTDSASVRTLSIVWGTRAIPGRAGTVGAWYRGLVTRAGGRVRPIVGESG